MTTATSLRNAQPQNLKEPPMLHFDGPTLRRHFSTHDQLEIPVCVRAFMYVPSQCDSLNEWAMHVSDTTLSEQERSKAIYYLCTQIFNRELLSLGKTIKSISCPEPFKLHIHRSSHCFSFVSAYDKITISTSDSDIFSSTDELFTTLQNASPCDEKQKRVQLTLKPNQKLILALSDGQIAKIKRETDQPNQDLLQLLLYHVPESWELRYTTTLKLNLGVDPTTGKSALIFSSPIKAILGFYKDAPENSGKTEQKADGKTTT